MPIVQQQVRDMYIMMTKFQVNLSAFELPNPCLKASNSVLQISGQIWYFSILFFFLSNLEVIWVENTDKMLLPFSPLINTCNLVNYSNIDYPTQPQTCFPLYSDFDLLSLFQSHLSLGEDEPLGLWYIYPIKWA